MEQHRRESQNNFAHQAASSRTLVTDNSVGSYASCVGLATCFDCAHSTHSPIVMRRSVSKAHGTARIETTSHHRLPRFAARTPNDVADSIKINPVTSDAGPFPPANVATAPTAGITKISETIDARPHLFTRDVCSALIPARSRVRCYRYGPPFLATSGASASVDTQNRPLIDS